MTTGWSWRAANDALLALGERGRSTLLLLARLPLVPVGTIQRLAGLSGGASVYRSLARLREAALVAAVRPPLQAGNPRQLLYLTDLGLAAVALDQRVDPSHLVRRNRLRGSDLRSLLARGPQLIATYELLGAVAASHAGRPNLLAWERPWRRRYQRPTAKAPVAVTLPAYAALSWGPEGSGAYLLLPDTGKAPLRSYRPTLDHLLVLRGLQRPPFPTLVVATWDTGRAGDWTVLLEEARRARSEAPLAARVTTWGAARDGISYLAGQTSGHGLNPDLVRRVPLRPLPPRLGKRLSGVVGEALAGTPPRPGTDEWGRMSLELTPADRALLEVVAQHPFLAISDLATVLGRSVRSTQRRRNRLLRRGLVRLLSSGETRAQAPAGELVEVTAAGLELLAAQDGVSLGAAVRRLGLAGGGPGRPVGPRRLLLKDPAHTLGADRVFVSLMRAARELAAAGGDDALVEWQSAAACSRRHLRPDGYGLYRRGAEHTGFFLEYDRGTMGARDYLEKFGAYYDYRATGRFERDYMGGFPVILVVTTAYTEERIVRAARAAAIGRGPTLEVFFTSQWRIEAPDNPEGLLGPIWRETDGTAQDRCTWLGGSAQAPGSTPGLHVPGYGVPHGRG